MSGILATRGLLQVVFIVYNNADDYPGRVVVRRWVKTPSYPTLVPEDALFCNEATLEDARRRIRAADPLARNQGRRPGDVRAVAEVWSQVPRGM